VLDFRQVTTRGGRSHFFRLRLRPCFKIFESGSGYGNFSDLKIRLLFRLRLPSIHPKFTHAFKKWPRRLMLRAKLRSDSGSGFSQNFDSGSEKKTQNPAGVDSGTPDPWPPLVIANDLKQCWIFTQNQLLSVDKAMRLEDWMKDNQILTDRPYSKALKSVPQKDGERHF